MKTIFENLNELIVELNTREIDKTTSLGILDNCIRDLINLNVPLDQRWSASNTVEEYLNRIKSGDTRYASGFNGHWAKWHGEQCENETD